MSEDLWGVADVSAMRGELAGQTVVVVGSGPSLHVQEIEEKCVFFFIGDSFLRTERRGSSNYFVRANSLFPNLEKGSHLELLRHLDATWVFARSVKESQTPVEKLLQKCQSRPSYTFDQRHFGAKPCEPRSDCCGDINPAARTLQEQVADLVGANNIYSAGSTVAIHAVALAILAGANRIRIVGVEIPMTQKEYRYAKALNGAPVSNHNSSTNDVTNLVHFFHFPVWLSRLAGGIFGLFRAQDGGSSSFAEDFESIMSDFQYLVDVGKQLGCEVEVLSSTSNLRQLRGIDVYPK